MASDAAGQAGLARLTHLFESTLTEDDPHGVNSFAHYETLLESQGDVDIAAGFVLMAMALQEKPHLHDKAILAYRRVLLLIEDKLQSERQPSKIRKKKWEKCSVYQQIAKLNLLKKNFPEAERLLLDLLDYIPDEEPDNNGRIFDGEKGDNAQGFNFGYTKTEFRAHVHKMLCNCYHNTNETEKCKLHYQLSINLLTDGGQKLTSAVPRDIQSKIAEQKKEKYTWDKMDDVKIAPLDATSYSWDSSANNGTVSVYVKLPPEITSGEQVKVSYPGESSDCVFLRMRVDDNKKEYRLVLSPLRHAINTEDTVAKMVSKKSGKKYSLLLFIKEKDYKRWGENLLQDGPNKFKHLLQAESKDKKPLPTLEEFDERVKSLPTPQENNFAATQKLKTAADVVDETKINKPSIGATNGSKAKAEKKSAPVASASTVASSVPVSVAVEKKVAEEVETKNEANPVVVVTPPPAPGVTIIDAKALSSAGAISPEPPAWASGLQFSEGKSLLFSGVGPEIELDMEISETSVRITASGFEPVEFKLAEGAGRKIDAGCSAAKRKKEEGNIRNHLCVRVKHDVVGAVSL